MRYYLKSVLAALTTLLLIVGAWAPRSFAQSAGSSYLSYVDGDRVVSKYAFGFGGVPGAFITSGNSSTGSQTITVCTAYVALPDGRTVNILGGVAGMAYVPITVDPQNSAVTETVTPTGVSLIPVPQGVNAQPN